MSLMNIPIERVRNFSIIAHIDHGKSTLADRLLDFGKLVTDREKKEQILDSMDIERERGITIKSNSATFVYQGKDGLDYRFNLIDTPGHVDFTYEVSRSLAACEGVLLLVDASQGIQAQTIANFYLALEADLYILPVINKIDLPSADIPKVKKQIAQSLGLDPEQAVPVSAKSGLGIEDLMQAVIDIIPSPSGKKENPLKALVFDAYFDAYRGVVEKIRVFDGTIRKNDKIFSMVKKTSKQVNDLGISQLKLVSQDFLQAGDVGYLITGTKNVSEVKLGDTITLENNKATDAVFKIKDIKPMVFSGLYPVNGDDYELLKEAIEKLALNDPALVYEPESSEALGFGFRVGYLGLLHLEIVQERLEREFHINLLTTSPSVKYRVVIKGEEHLEIDNPSEFPEVGTIEKIKEPYVKITIMAPAEFLGGILQLLQEKRGENSELNYIDTETVQIVYFLPLGEMIFEFYDRLKSVSKGYASMDYEFVDYRPSDLVKLDILVHGTKVDALSLIVHRMFAERRGREVISQLRKLISKHQFQIALQAAIGSKIIARENISALRKNVTAKCYGGDISRKRKLLERQKEGKKRMKMIGSVEIPQEAFLAVLKTDENSFKDK